MDSRTLIQESALFYQLLLFAWIPFSIWHALQLNLPNKYPPFLYFALPATILLLAGLSAEGYERALDGVDLAPYLRPLSVFKFHEFT